MPGRKALWPGLLMTVLLAGVVFLLSGCGNDVAGTTSTTALTDQSSTTLQPTTTLAPETTTTVESTTTTTMVAFEDVMFGGDAAHTGVFGDPGPALQGEEAWSVQLPAWYISSPVVADGVVYIGCFDQVCAFDAATGEELWQFSPGTVVTSSPMVSGGIL